MINAYKSIFNKFYVNSAKRFCIQNKRKYMTGVPKALKFGDDARLAMLKGSQIMSDSIGLTLGPNGRNVLFTRREFETPRITKDGRTIAHYLYDNKLDNPWDGAGVSLVYTAANHTNEAAGDGTTTTSILTEALFREGLKAIEAGMNPMDLKRGIQSAVIYITKYILPLLCDELLDKEAVYNIARVASNNDDIIGRLVADAIDKVGLDGCIEIEEGYTYRDELHLQEGMIFKDRGYIYSKFVTDWKSTDIIFEKALICIFDEDISSSKQVFNILNKTHNAGRPLVIFAYEIKEEPLDFLLKNRRINNVDVVFIRTPPMGDLRKYTSKDIAAYTGATVLSDKIGLKLENAQLADLGQCNKIIIGRKSTAIIGGKGNPKDIEDQIDAAKLRSTQVYKQQSEFHLSRIPRLQGAVACIKIGGINEVSILEKKDRITDSVNAVRSGVDEGIVPGGGFSLLYSTLFLSSDLFLKSMNIKNEDQLFGVEIVKKCLSIPSKLILNNSGYNGALVTYNLLYKAQEELYNNNLFEFADNLIIEKLVNDGIFDNTTNEYWNIKDNKLKLNDLKLSKEHEKLLVDLDNRYQIIWQSKSRRQRVGLGINDVNERLLQLNKSIDNTYEIDEISNDNWEKKHKLMEILRHGFNSNLARNKYDQLNKIDNSCFCDLIDDGIVDPIKVIKHGLMDSASVAGLMLSTECLVIDSPNWVPDMPTVDRGEPVNFKDYRRPLVDDPKENEELYKQIDMEYAQKWDNY